MNPTPKMIHAALAAGRPADRAFACAPRFVSGANVRAALPAVMGNRAFVRAWAARRAKAAAHPAP